MAKIIPFQKKGSPPSLEKIRQLAKSSHGIELSTHARKRMKERDVSQRQIMEVLQKGHIEKEPKKDEHGSWRFKLKRKVAGRTTQIITAIYENKLVIITVI